jgi:diguanylate cyclase (GGDEF)-like protein
MDATIALGHVYYGMQRFDQALVPFERALRTARALGDRIAEGGLLDTIACVYGNQANSPAMQADQAAMRSLLAKALDLWEQAAPIARETGHRRNQAAVLANEAEALVALDRPEDALVLLGSWKLDPKVDLARSIWHIRDTEGVACLRLGRHAEAIDKFTEALPYADGGAMKMVVHEHLAEAFEQAGDTASALMHYKRFHAAYKQLASEAAQRSASVAAVRLATEEANAMAIAERDRAEELAVSNDLLSRRAEDLMQLSLEDPLTGLANRRMMDKLLEADARGFAVAMIDVDHFKRVNDGWSHATGDEVLKRLAVLMRGCCRASDTPIRCGGEEFAILLRHLNEEGTQLTAERIRHAIETFDWTSIAPGLAVTVSIGIALASEAETIGEALALADRRLYAAKRAGRNRVVGRAFESAQE